MTDPQLAQPAIQMGPHAARQIIRLDRGETTKAFRYFDKGTMATISNRAAIVQLPVGPRITGIIAWLTWVLLHLWFLLGGRNRITTFINLMYRYVLWPRVTPAIVGDLARNPDEVPGRGSAGCAGWRDGGRTGSAASTEGGMPDRIPWGGATTEVVRRVLLGPNRLGTAVENSVDLCREFENPCPALRTVASRRSRGVYRRDRRPLEPSVVDERGRMVRAVGMTQTLLSPEQVDELVAAYEAGATLVELGERFSVHRRTAAAQLVRRSPPPIRRRGLDKCSPKQSSCTTEA